MSKKMTMFCFIKKEKAAPLPYQKSISKKLSKGGSCHGSKTKSSNLVLQEKPYTALEKF